MVLTIAVNLSQIVRQGSAEKAETLYPANGREAGGVIEGQKVPPQGGPRRYRGVLPEGRGPCRGFPASAAKRVCIGQRHGVVMGEDALLEDVEGGGQKGLKRRSRTAASSATPG